MPADGMIYDVAISPRCVVRHRLRSVGEDRDARCRQPASSPARHAWTGCRHVPGTWASLLGQPETASLSTQFCRARPRLQARPVVEPVSQLREVDTRELRQIAHLLPAGDWCRAMRTGRHLWSHEFLRRRRPAPRPHPSSSTIFTAPEYSFAVARYSGRGSPENRDRGRREAAPITNLLVGVGGTLGRGDRSRCARGEPVRPASSRAVRPRRRTPDDTGLWLNGVDARRDRWGFSIRSA